jgi:transketolase
MSGTFKNKINLTKADSKKIEIGQRRAIYINISEYLKKNPYEISEKELSAFEDYDLTYRTLCGILYNFVPTSGHPGGSISSGRMVSSTLFNTMDYDLSDPTRKEADIISYAAGHKAMGLYAMWGLRNEVARIGSPEILAKKIEWQLRLEDMLGFRRNPNQDTPLFKKFQAKPLDGHPTPATPFIKISTGPSGVGVGSSVGLALGAMDMYADNPPYVHIIEGEGGMTPGRVYEALAAASSASINNIVLHVDWNQASIDSNRVCRDGDKPGDYVQWDPVELLYMNDFNVIYVENGFDFKLILPAQQLAVELTKITKQPSAVVYKTIKGWQYGIEGKASHGAGHKFCSKEYYEYLKKFEDKFGVKFPVFDGNQAPDNVEKNFYDSLMVLRGVLEKNSPITTVLATKLKDSKNRLESLDRKPRAKAPEIAKIYEPSISPSKVPDELKLKIGASTTIRGALGDALNYLNKASGGGIFASAADLFGSTSISNIGKGFPEGFYNSNTNPGSRLIAIGGICEDAIGNVMAGLAAYGCHVGVGSSYGAFIAALQHIAARVHGIGQQTKQEIKKGPYNPFIIVCGHAGIKTGEDGPTHADPQPLQLLQGNFPKNVMITLTPWDLQEVWPLIVTALQKRPAVIAPFVTRPNETVVDRASRKLPPADACVTGIYAWRKADMAAKQYNGSIVMQGSEVGIDFFNYVLPKIDEKGLNMNVYYIASAELFDMLSPDKQKEIYPEERSKEAMGITGFTFPTMCRWITSLEGRNRTLYPFKKGHFLGSGRAESVIREAGLSGEDQWHAVLEYAKMIEKKNR